VHVGDELGGPHAGGRADRSRHAHLGTGGRQRRPGADDRVLPAGGPPAGGDAADGPADRVRRAARPATGAAPAAAGGRRRPDRRPATARGGQRRGGGCRCTSCSRQRRTPWHRRPHRQPTGNPGRRPGRWRTASSSSPAGRTSAGRARDRENLAATLELIAAVDTHPRDPAGLAPYVRWADEIARYELGHLGDAQNRLGLLEEMVVARWCSGTCWPSCAGWRTSTTASTGSLATTAREADGVVVGVAASRMGVSTHSTARLVFS
jgi:hypothetical protein